MSEAQGPYTRDEIGAALATQGRELAAFFSSVPPEDFFSGTDERWSAAHHVQHLTLSVGPIARAMRAPDRLPPTPPGTVSRPFEAVRAAYLAALGPGVPNTGRFAPRLEEGRGEDGRAAVVAGFSSAVESLGSALESWEDAALDTLAVPHPLLGPLTAREMLLFTLYHNRHHEAGVRRRLAEL